MYDFQILGNEASIIAGYKDEKIFYFSLFGCKVMAKQHK